MNACPIIDAVKTLIDDGVIGSINTQRLLVGFSGGLDSTVLLHALSQYLEPRNIVALHVHHGLSIHADDWLMHCQEQAQHFGVDFFSEHVQLNSHKKGIEAAARDARYRVFLEYVKQKAVKENMTSNGSQSRRPIIFLGHHLDDQQETLLLRLMRGAGPTGLQSMPRQRSLGHGWIVRPFLQLSRKQLHDYAIQHQLRWIEDDSNADNRFDRNFLRNQLIPLLNKRWPNAAHRCAQTAALCVENESLLADLAQQDTAKVKYADEALGFSVCITALAALKRARRNNLLRYLFAQQGFAMPEQIHLQELDAQLAFDQPSGNASPSCQVRWGNVQLCTFQNRLYSLPFDKHQPNCPAVNDHYLWGGRSPLILPLGELGYAMLSLTPGGDWHWKGRPIRVFFRTSRFYDGNALIEAPKRMQPHQRQHSQTFKKLLQEYRVPTWLRPWIPLLQEQELLQEQDAGECGAVGDLWVNEGSHAPNQTGYQVTWTLLPPEKPV